MKFFVESGDVDAIVVEQKVQKCVSLESKRGLEQFFQLLEMKDCVSYYRKGLLRSDATTLSFGATNFARKFVNKRFSPQPFRVDEPRYRHPLANAYSHRKGHERGGRHTSRFGAIEFRKGICL